MVLLLLQFGEVVKPFLLFRIPLFYYKSNEKTGFFIELSDTFSTDGS
jgi:hypothetical protein